MGYLGKDTKIRRPRLKLAVCNMPVLFMMRDFFKVMAGESYFHEAPALGGYFLDRRSYYYDFRKKTQWNGEYKNKVPLLYLPSLQKQIHFPIMILQYGIGSIDAYFATQAPSCLNNIENVTRWILENLNPDFSFNNYFPEIMPQYQYHSSNSAMAQGHALSFLARVLKFALINKDFVDKAQDAVRNIFLNMIRPVEAGGTAIKKDNDIYFCEVCRKDDYVVLNGWIFAIFGLMDYAQYFDNPTTKDTLEATLKTLKKDLANYFLASGWTYYDNKGRSCSPNYHEMQIELFNALNRLALSPEFKTAYEKSIVANKLHNKIKFTMLKILEKLKAAHTYTTKL